MHGSNGALNTDMPNSLSIEIFKGKLRMQSRLILIPVLVFLTGCTSALPSDPESQLDYACQIITGWPTDYATVWPTAVKKHNESPEEVSAADYMKGYVESMALAVGISDPRPSTMVDQYKIYWELLEQDLIFGGGRLPQNPISTGIVSDLMRECDDLGRGFKQE